MEAFVSNFKVLSRHLPGGTDEDHENSQSWQPVSGPRFEPVTSRIRRSVDHSTTTFRNRLLRSACLAAKHMFAVIVPVDRVTLCLRTATNNGLVDRPMWVCRDTAEWYWNRKNRRTRRRTWPSATLYTANPTWADPGPAVRGRRLTTWATS
jgi:hypothetical protein